MKDNRMPESITSEQIKALGYEIENNKIERFELIMDAHFGMSSVLNIWCKNCELFPYINCGIYLSEILKMLCLCLNLKDEMQCNEDDIKIFDVKNLPIRIVVDGNKVVGFGHYMDDRFYITQELIVKAKENTHRYIDYIKDKE